MQQGWAPSRNNRLRWAATLGVKRQRRAHTAPPPPPPPALQGGYPSIDARTLYQSTLLHVAARHGHTELAAALLARGADVNSLDYGGMRRSPLHWACKGGHVALVELLVEAGADTKVGPHGFYAPHTAAAGCRMQTAPPPAARRTCSLCAAAHLHPSLHLGSVTNTHTPRHLCTAGNKL